MAIRVRKDGTMWCAAHTEPMEGDTYIDDGEHYFLSVERGLIVALPMPDHERYCQWWWAGHAPPEADFSAVKRAAAERRQIESIGRVSEHAERHFQSDR